ncbi:ubiquitin domain-containing protein UBFD1-like [Coccinella septempunctata]|uniref:ubiquitin domain-containing protein UBFD1-like n=1 Tax=Coccinella septempunctata TaxID=41139 RepID=UPI001D091025|nr:ubiquitin domain-containing protein UBFD1-like [Coccinella septempunctata]
MEQNCEIQKNDSKVLDSSENNESRKTDDLPSECKIKKTEEPADKENSENGRGPEDLIEIKIIFSKKKYDVQISADATVATLKKQLQGLLGVPDSMQKLMFKGLLQDNQTLKSAGVVKGTKIMLVGSTLKDVLAVSSVSKQDVAEAEKAGTTKEPLCKQKLHKKILDKGLPEDVMPGIKNVKERLPPAPLSGMLNKHGGKVRLTFKLEQDQLWLSTKERTEKLPMSSIKNVISESIEGHEEYHIMGLQLGPTEASRYWIYWVPAQYIDAIKDAVLGKWQYF